MPQEHVSRLGKMTDAKLAGQLGVTASVIKAERNRRGIPSYLSQLKAARRICSYCGKPKPPHVASSTKYCCDECRLAARIKYRAGPTPHGTCANPNCDKLLFGRNLYFCSNECRWEIMRINRAPNYNRREAVGLTETDKAFILAHYESKSYRAIAQELGAGHKPGAISGFISRQGLRKASLKPGSVAVA